MEKKYYIFIMGCQMNESDAERLSSFLDDSGFRKTEKEEAADVIIVLACSVRQSAIDRIWGKMRNWQKIKEKRPLITILSGCVLPKDKKKFSDYFDYIVDVKDFGQTPVKLLEKIKKLTPLEKKTSLDDYFKIHPRYASKVSAYVPIMTGCNNFCTYCAVPYARGREKSRPWSEIIREIKYLLGQGYKKITLLGQNVNSYGQDFNKPRSNNQSHLILLLKKIDNLQSDFWFYFITNHPKDMSDELIKTLPSLKKFGHYIHLPFQAGDNEVLKRMNRNYTIKHYQALVKKIRTTLPDVNLTTDIIVGFSGETKKQFLNSLRVLKKGEFDQAYIAQYSPRPNTAALNFNDNIPKSEKRGRKKVLTKALEKIALKNNKKYLNKIQRVLIEEYKNGYNLGHTKNFKNIRFKDKKNYTGQFHKIRINKATPWALEGIKKGLTADK